MKIRNLFTALVMVMCCLLLAQEAQAQSDTFGYTSAYYNESTNTVSVTATTEPDYLASEYYESAISATLYDEFNNQVASTSLRNPEGVTVSVGLEANATYGQAYTARGIHTLLARYISDYDLSTTRKYYDAYYYFRIVDCCGPEGSSIWGYTRFGGLGPAYDSTYRNLRLGTTWGATAALVMPQDYGPGYEAWKNLTPAEKKFVIWATEAAIDFYYQAQEALQESQTRFPDSLQNGRGDAFRHAYWSAMMAQSRGANLAEQYGNAHEDFPGNRTPVRNMDLHNNGVGRQIGVDNPGASRAQLANLVVQSLNEGRLRFICPPDCRP